MFVPIRVIVTDEMYAKLQAIATREYRSTKQQAGFMLTDAIERDETLHEIPIGSAQSLQGKVSGSATSGQTGKPGRGKCPT
jgi:hypothetical protein